MSGVLERTRLDWLAFGAMSYRRAKIACMNCDPINAALWAIAGFDPALVHFVELREHFAKTYPGDRDVPVAIDRALGVYMEAQCRELQAVNGVTMTEVDHLITERLGEKSVNLAMMHAVTCTEDALILEVLGYGMHLAVLTSHGSAPWTRLANVMGDCFVNRPKAVCP